MTETTYDHEVRKLCSAVAELCIQKHRDYGTGNLLNTPFSPDIMLAVRLNEKIARLANLVQKQEKPANESEFDSIIDIIGYSIAWLMIKEGTFELPMADTENVKLNSRGQVVPIDASKPSFYGAGKITDAAPGVAKFYNQGGYSNLASLPIEVKDK